MALRYKDALSEMIGNDDLSNRINNLVWVLLHLLQISFNQLNFPPGDRNSPVRVLRQNNIQLNTLREKLKQGQIAIEHFDWINHNDPRQIKWLENYYIKNYYNNNYHIYQKLTTHLTGRDLIISLVDALDLIPELIKNNLQISMIEWLKHLDGDKPFKWLKLKNEKDRCEFTFNWLKSNNYTYTQEALKYEDFDAIMIIIDSLGSSDKEKELLIMKIRKSWDQANFRKKLTGKRQTNLILQDSTINLLDKMSKKYDLSRAEIINFLVRTEDGENNRYLEAREQRRLNFLED